MVGTMRVSWMPHKWLLCFCPNPSKTQEDLEAQVTLVENLRKYVGEQVPPEARSQVWEPERQELLDAVQVGESRRAAAAGLWGIGAGHGVVLAERDMVPERKAVLFGVGRGTGALRLILPATAP